MCDLIQEAEDEARLARMLEAQVVEEWKICLLLAMQDKDSDFREENSKWEIMAVIFSFNIILFVKYAQLESEQSDFLLVPRH